MAASLTWGKGPIYLFYAYEKLEDVSSPNAAANTGNFTFKEQEANSVGGSWVIGPIKVGGLYAEYKKSDRTKKKSYMLNGVWTVGKHQFIYQYQDSKDGGCANGTVTNAAIGCGAVNTVVVEQPESSSNTLGYQYNFSRRTFFLAQYVKVDNNNAAGTNYGNFGSNRLTLNSSGQDPQGFAVGFRHVF
jgi:predicted porin